MIQIIILTGLGNASFALCDSWKLLGCDVILANQQSEELLPKIITCLQENQLSLQSIDTIYYVQGPGGFSALRGGISIIQGIKDVKRLLNQPLKTVGMSSLAVLYFLHQQQQEEQPDIIKTTTYFKNLISCEFFDSENIILYDAKMNEYYQQEIDIKAKNSPFLRHKNSFSDAEKNNYKLINIEFTASQLLTTFTQNQWNYFDGEINRSNNQPNNESNNVFIDYVRCNVAQTIEQRKNIKL